MSSILLINADNCFSLSYSDGGADCTMRNGSGDALAAALLHNWTYCMTSFYALLSDNCMTSK